LDKGVQLPKSNIETADSNDNRNPIALLLEQSQLDHKLIELIDQYPDTQISYKAQKIVQDHLSSTSQLIAATESGLEND